ncbi:type VI secretion system protein TssA [Oxalobacteraceae bacterium A2-2]
MSTIDTDEFLQELDSASPCGPDLEYDPDFVALEVDVLGKPEVQYGDTITPAVPPDWKLVAKAARALLARSRDLRPALHLLRASLALHGVPGLADGLRLIERLLAERWDSVHPQLDADDGMDPTLRINSLAVLTDRTTVLKDLKEATLVVLPGLGPLSLRTLEIANGELAAPEGTEKIATASLELALRDTNAEALAVARDALARACESATNIELLLERHVGRAQSLNLEGLIRLLKRGRDFLASQDQDQAQAEAAAEGDDEADYVSDGAGGTPRRAAGISGEIASRDDVVRMLDKLIGYYERHEPSSPLPLLLLRAKRLVPKSFMEIMEDIAPDAVHQVNVLRGPQEEQGY